MTCATRPFCRFTVIAALTVLLLGCSRPQTRPLTPPKAKPIGKVILIPVGTMDKGYLIQLSRYYKEKLHLDVAVSDPLPDISIGMPWDEQRKQYKARALLGRIEHISNPDPTRISTSLVNLKTFRVLIAVVNKDTFDEGEPGNNFIFATAADAYSGQRFGLVSIARFDPAFFGQRHDGKLVKERMRKFVTQKIGQLAYDLPRNDDPGSVLYRGTDNLGALDRVGEGF